LAEGLSRKEIVMTQRPSSLPGTAACAAALLTTLGFGCSAETKAGGERVPQADTIESDAGTPPATTDGSDCVDGGWASQDAGSESHTDLCDSAVVAVMSTANTGEIAQGEAAVCRTQDPEVVAFANLMIEDHTAAQRKLLALELDDGAQKGRAACDAGAGEAIAARLKHESDATVAALEQLSDDALDDFYAASQVKAHAAVLSLIDEVLLPSAQSAALQAYLSAARGTVASHLEHAKELEKAEAADMDESAELDAGSYVAR
jgi:putative membrane protein